MKGKGLAIVCPKCRDGGTVYFNASVRVKHKLIDNPCNLYSEKFLEKLYPSLCNYATRFHQSELTYMLRSAWLMKADLALYKLKKYSRRKPNARSQHRLGLHDSDKNRVYFTELQHE